MCFPSAIYIDLRLVRAVPICSIRLFDDERTAHAMTGYHYQSQPHAQHRGYYQR
jgi:hypothetical protein